MTSARQDDLSISVEKHDQMSMSCDHLSCPRETQSTITLEIMIASRVV